MKKGLRTLLASMMLMPFLHAQIIIQSSDVLQVNTFAQVARDTNIQVLDLGFPGWGNVWDYTSLKKTDSVNSLVTHAEGKIGNSHFPSANIAIIEEDSTVQFIYKSLSELRFLGFATLESTGDTTYVDLDVQLMIFPSIYNSKFNDASRPFSFKVELGVDPDGPGPHGVVDSLEFRSMIGHNSTMDAQGILKLPGDAEYEVIRQNIQQVTRDTLFMLVNGTWTVISDVVASAFFLDSVSSDTSNILRFLAPEMSYPIAEIEVVPPGVTTRAQWVESISLGLAVAEQPKELNVFPNPADDYLEISGAKEDLTIEFHDLNGRLVYATQSTGNGRISTAMLSQGAYLLSISQRGAEPRRLVVQIRH